MTIAELLKQNGYATGCFGKWYLGYVPPWLPPNQGFDEFRGLASGDGDHQTHIDRWGRNDWWHNNRIAMEEGYTAELLTKYSINFIETHRDRAFFLYLPQLAIHFPWQGPNDPPHRVAGKDYEKDKWGVILNPGNVSPQLKAMIELVDKSVGEIVVALKRWKLGRRTVVIFTSDNGGYLNYGAQFQNISSNGPLRGQKGSVYEGGHRVPMIVSWPGTIAPAKRPTPRIFFRPSRSWREPVPTISHSTALPSHHGCSAANRCWTGCCSGACAHSESCEADLGRFGSRAPGPSFSIWTTTLVKSMTSPGRSPIW